MSGDRLGWAAAGFAAALVHGALAYAATLVPAATPPPQVDVEIEMLELGGGLALQPSPVEAVMSGIAPQAVQQQAAVAAQQPVTSQAPLTKQVGSTAPVQALAAASTAQPARVASVAPTAAAPVQPSIAPQQAATAIQTVSGPAPVTVHIAVPANTAAGQSAVTVQSQMAAQPSAEPVVASASTTASTVPAAVGTSIAPVAAVASNANAVAATTQSAGPAASPVSAVQTAIAALPGIPTTPATVAASTPAVAAVQASPVAAAASVPVSSTNQTVAAVAPISALPTVNSPIAEGPDPSSEIAPTQPTAAPPADTVANLADPNGAAGLPVPTRTDLVNLITDFSSAECFSASPAPTKEGGFAVESFAIAADDTDRLRDAVLDAFGDQVSFQGSTITPEQCRALGFLGGAGGAVGEKVQLGVDTRSIASGSALTGVLEGTKGRVVHLLIVDDDGKIQAANAYTEQVGDDTRFEVPVVVTGSGSTRAQILFAVVVDETIQTAAEAVDVPADKFFDALEFELIVKGLEADLSVASFTVE